MPARDSSLPAVEGAVLGRARWKAKEGRELFFLRFFCEACGEEGPCADELPPGVIAPLLESMLGLVPAAVVSMVGCREREREERIRRERELLV